MLEGKHIGCLTTPAPDDQGREIPPGRSEADFAVTELLRWRSDKKKFAVWTYQDANLAWDGNGNWRQFSAEQR